MAILGASTSNELSKIVYSADGTAIYAEALGDPTKPALIFIHGFSLSLKCFDGIFADPAWTDEAYLIRYDTRGHGRSSMPELATAYESRRMSEDYIAVTEAFGIQRAFIVGWSIGGAAAADVCSFPGASVLHGIIYLDALPFCSSEFIPRVITGAIAAIIPGLLEAGDVALFSRAIVQFVESCVYQKEKMPYELRAACLGDVVLPSPTVRQLCLSRVQDPTSLQQAGKTTPLLMIHGEEDAHIVGKKIEAEMKPHFGDRLEVHYLKGVGHAPFIEEPEKTRDLVLSFVKTVMASV
ncbi:alpha/beta-hydrolase [Calocera viscosa TUFC12733]|uniref:Alpha/beta-hydrolase n=1 Tax=Calocera viscosa (strain TUFC12733) TaxID=1330018 RepID=A0A167G925_CALVF|nr:alpha/beta-hydrolase [Calocera viscosa TUFC12733]